MIKRAAQMSGLRFVRIRVLIIQVLYQLIKKAEKVQPF